MKTFTSIFHEEVIPMNEFKSDIKDQNEWKRNQERQSNLHRDKDDNGATYATRRPVTNKKDYDRREEHNREHTERLKEIQKKKDEKREYNKERAKAREAKNESFLPNIKLI